MDRLAKENYDLYRNKMMEDARRFQDFVCDALWEEGIVVQNYSSAQWQFRMGENKNGIEIKNDHKFWDTGNLYIELCEKSKPRNGQYAESGIKAKDHSWLYVIGDRQKLFIFSKNILNLLADSGRYKIVENETKTSMGMLLPVKSAERYAAKIIKPKIK